MTSGQSMQWVVSEDSLPLSAKDQLLEGWVGGVDTERGAIATLPPFPWHYPIPGQSKVGFSPGARALQWPPFQQWVSPVIASQIVKGNWNCQSCRQLQSLLAQMAAPFLATTHLLPCLSVKWSQFPCPFIRPAAQQIPPGRPSTLFT